MKRTIVFAVLLGLAAVAATPHAASGASIDTRVTLVVGFPGDGDDALSVLVVPGTVIPVSGKDHRRLNIDEESAERTEQIRELADKLQHAVGLSAAEVAYSEVYTLEEGKAWQITGPRAASTISGRLTLTDFNTELAVFRVELRQGTEVLADSRVAVERGGRAVVGSMNGAEAPYLFLVLEPAAEALFVKGDITHPRKIHSVAPEYTELARESRLQGIVVLQALINEKGVVEEIEVIQGLPFGLSEAASEALRQWTFEPATLHGEPVSVFYRLTFNFRLTEEKQGE